MRNPRNRAVRSLAVEMGEKDTTLVAAIALAGVVVFIQCSSSPARPFSTGSEGC
jgi:hypothetical protein